MTSSDRRVPVAIRPLGLRDLRGLLAMARGGVTLNAPDSVVEGFAPLRELLRVSPLLYRRQLTRTYVARCASTACALLQARDRGWPPKWDIVYLGAAEGMRATGRQGRAELWTALLDYTTAAAGRRGVPRLYAKLPVVTDEAAERAFQDAGYVPYGAETIYELRGGTPFANVPGQDGEATEVRPQLAEDTWAVHQLYTLTEPKPAQYAEAYTSQRWDLTRQRFSRQRSKVYGVVIDRSPDLVGYCRVTKHGKHSRIDLLVQPQARELLGCAIDATLRWLRPAHDERVYCALREHQQDLHTVLTARGFRPRGTQHLLIRYTVVSIRATSGAPNRVRERVRAAVPAHVLGSLGAIDTADCHIEEAKQHAG